MYLHLLNHLYDCLAINSFYKFYTSLCEYIPTYFILIFILFFAIFNIDAFFFFHYSLQKALVHVLESKHFLQFCKKPLKFSYCSNGFFSRLSQVFHLYK